MAKEMTFTIPEKLVKKFKNWKETLPERKSTIGGRFTFEFTPNEKGIDIWVVDGITDAAINLTEDEKR